MPPRSKENKTNPAAEMSFLDHLEALRWHLVRSAAVILTLAVILFLNKGFLFDSILLAPKYPSFPTYRALCFLSHQFNLGDDLCVTQINFSLVSTDLSAQFAMHMWSAFVGALIAGFPYLAFELWRFIRPALREKELQYARGIVFFTSALFLIGALFGYYVIAAMSVNFLGSYQVSSEVKNMITLDSFVSTVTTMTLITGLLFELPIAIYFLTKIGIVTAGFMRTYRRHAVVIILIAAAVITPTSDAATLMLVAVPLYVLFEASIFVSATVGKKQAIV